MIMMDQYNKETSQIHAPVDLIRRTKEAVREEEQRIAGEQMQQKTVVQPKRSYGKVYKWALHVAAAAVCLILFNVGVMRPGSNTSGSGMGKSQSGASMDMGTGAAESNDMGLQFAAADMHEEATATTAQEPISKDSSSYDVTEEAAEEEIYEGESYDGGQSEDAVDENTENGYANSNDGGTLQIEAVDEAPAFYGEPDTECFTIHGIKIYVACDIDDTWIAYARKSKQRYVISGEATQETVSREEFAEEAYELLMETISSAE